MEATKPPLKGQTPVGKKCTCFKCKKTMDANKQFYTYKDGSKSKMCKQCLTMHIDNTDPQTFLWLLEDFDVPYVPGEWNTLLERAYAKDHNLNGMSVFGRYLSKMKLKQFRSNTWADSKRLQEEAERNAAAAGMSIIGTEADRQAYESQVEELKEQLENGQINQAQFETLLPAEVLTKEMAPEEEEPDYNKPTSNADVYAMTGNAFGEDIFMKEDDLPDPGAELTEEDKIYLAMKWGRLYKPNEWVQLERDYNEMMESFDIQDADTEKTLILICKTNLKMNQALDCGDVDGYLKLTRVYDSLRKSAKFTAAQNKGADASYVDSIGELVLLCEREEGFIPRWDLSIPQDKVDFTLKDMEKYLYNLVTNDLGFGDQIEMYIKKIELEKENEKELDQIGTGETLEEIEEEVIKEVEDDDIIEYYDDIEEQRDIDKDVTQETVAFGGKKGGDS